MAVVTSRSVFVAVLSAAATIAVAACSSSSSPAAGGNNGSTPARSGTSAGSKQATTPVAPPTEVHPPGDIPDNQAFVAYAGNDYRLVVPEGWSRTMRGKSVQFSDKYNSITVSDIAAARRPTVATARSQQLPAIRSTANGFRPGSITTVQRRAGTAVLITYRDVSPVNPVTGKVVQQAVERYEFWSGGREVVITLAAPVGSDNVDPWRRVTDAFAWKH